MDKFSKEISIIVAIPCLNEEVSIGKVVSDFKAIFRNAIIYVFDNNSSDRSITLAKAAGAEVVRENRRGKGYVMQAILERVDCDVLIVVDGDDTYPAEEVERLVAPIINGDADMVVGTRLENANDSSLRRLHHIGNLLILNTINLLFGTQFKDVLSGYRAFSRRFLMQVPLLTGGFETETELTIQALELGLVIKEVPITYRKRLLGSYSKLRTFKDGYQILVTIAVLLRDHRPLAVFGTFGTFCILIGLVAGVLRFIHFTGVSALSFSILSSGIILFSLAGIAFIGLGLILNSVNIRSRETLCLLRRFRQ